MSISCIGMWIVSIFVALRRSSRTYAEILEVYCQHVRGMRDKVYKIVLYIVEIAGMALLRLFKTSVQSNQTLEQRPLFPTMTWTLLLNYGY